MKVITAKASLLGEEKHVHVQKYVQKLNNLDSPRYDYYNIVFFFLASRFLLLCDSDVMTAVFNRADLPKHTNVNQLALRHRRCKAYSNSTHVIVKAPLSGCGTIFSKDDQSLFFTNVLSEQQDNRTSGAVITRGYLFKAKLTCTYPRKRSIGSFSFAPAKERQFVSLGKWVF